MIVFPCFLKSKIICKNDWISSCPNTAVGSSKIKVSTFLYNNFKISVFCCWPTVKSLTFLFKFKLKLYLSIRACNSFLIFLALMMPKSFVLSSPKITFSQTLNSSISLKCWCTIPKPILDASLAELKLTCSPLILMVPVSAL